MSYIFRFPDAADGLMTPDAVAEFLASLFVERTMCQWGRDYPGANRVDSFALLPKL